MYSVSWKMKVFVMSKPNAIMSLAFSRARIRAYATRIWNSLFARLSPPAHNRRSNDADKKRTNRRLKKSGQVSLRGKQKKSLPCYYKFLILSTNAQLSSLVVFLLCETEKERIWNLQQQKTLHKCTRKTHVCTPLRDQRQNKPTRQKLRLFRTKTVKFRKRNKRKKFLQVNKPVEARAISKRTFHRQWVGQLMDNWRPFGDNRWKWTESTTKEERRRCLVWLWYNSHTFERAEQTHAEHRKTEEDRDTTENRKNLINTTY